MRTQPTLMLIHGPWHDGSAWVQVQTQLAAAGVRSHVPTLPGPVPELYAPMFDTLALPNFDRLDIPTVYIHCTPDHTLPAGTFHPGQSSQLKTPTISEVDADHEALFTAPNRLASALLEAIDSIRAREQSNVAV